MVKAITDNHTSYCNPTPFVYRRKNNATLWMLSISTTTTAKFLTFLPDYTLGIYNEYPLKEKIYAQ
jgi:hypothetical protein